MDIKVSDDLVRGYIAKVLYDPNECEVRVRLKTGTEGVVHNIVTKAQLEKETFKFYNLFFHSKHLLTIWDKHAKQSYISPIRLNSAGDAERTAFVFSDEDLAKAFLQELGRPELALRRISRRKTVLENFSKESVDAFRLNEQRKVSNVKMKRLEEHFSRF